MRFISFPIVSYLNTVYRISSNVLFTSVDFICLYFYCIQVHMYYYYYLNPIFIIIQSIRSWVNLESNALTLAMTGVKLSRPLRDAIAVNFGHMAKREASSDRAHLASVPQHSCLSTTFVTCSAHIPSLAG